MDLFRKVGWLEGVSFLLLMGLAMPLKYFAGWSLGVKVVGMAHGILFILYVVLMCAVSIEFKWSKKLSLLAFLAAVLPFGTFVFDHKYLKGHPQQNS